ncbi:putative nulp1-pending protein [Venturia nashicola]|uniref:Putative nulp1-pending protein n=1 Tax=Venturia nashicola TaxID=86259 RepID=A0A4Z1P0W0_9PEZI|nr:putative nulp1-pending protein [Venturia nashicola]TLD19010.1 putative nulp1-pending protein [Venturia nashicola]
MSTRALRKAQRELEEKVALEKAAEEEQSEEEPAKATQKSLFALLNEQDDDDDNENHEESEKEDAKQSNAITPPPAKSSKKKRKKKKAKSAPKAENGEETDDSHFDAELASAIAANKKANSNTRIEKESSTSTASRASDRVGQLLSVNTQNLHVANEMRRLFGRDAVDAERRAPAPARRGGRRGQGEPDRGFPSLSLRRNIFIQGKEEWPRATTGGLGMDIVKKNGDGTIEYRIIHSTAYQSTQKDYEVAVASMDPNRMVALLQHNPYHAATLLQVSEIMKHQGQHAEAGDLLERVLFSYGRAVHSTFSHSLSQGKARLSFRNPENREFFLSTWRYIQNISMRSTWRTVYEWSKLLLSLAPEEDPYALKLVIDQYALRAQQGQHYLEFLNGDTLGWKGEEPWHAHISYSLALSCLQASEMDEAREQLAAAIHDCPHLANALLRSLDIDIPPAIWSYHEPSSPREALLTTLYISRAKDLWLAPEASSLLVSVAKEVHELSKASHDDVVSLAEARHIYLTEDDAFIRLLSGCEIQDSGPSASPGPRPTWDPFPPHDNIESYDPRPAGHYGGRGSQGIGARNLTHVAPGLEALGNLPREQLEALLREIQGIQGMEDGTGGMDLNLEDAGLEELMANLGVTRRIGDGWHDEDEDEEGDGGEESSDNEMPVLE